MTFFGPRSWHEARGMRRSALPYCGASRVVWRVKPNHLFIFSYLLIPLPLAKRLTTKILFPVASLLLLILRAAMALLVSKHYLSS